MQLWYHFQNNFKIYIRILTLRECIALVLHSLFYEINAFHTFNKFWEKKKKKRKNDATFFRLLFLAFIRPNMCDFNSWCKLKKNFGVNMWFFFHNFSERLAFMLICIMIPMLINYDFSYYKPIAGKLVFILHLLLIHE